MKKSKPAKSRLKTDHIDSKIVRNLTIFAINIVLSRQESQASNLRVKKIILVLNRIILKPQNNTSMSWINITTMFKCVIIVNKL